MCEQVLQADLTDQLGLRKLQLNEPPRGTHATEESLNGDSAKLVLKTPRDRKAAFDSKTGLRSRLAAEENRIPTLDPSLPNLVIYTSK
jgi:hypothetical protein